MYNKRTKQVPNPDAVYPPLDLKWPPLPSVRPSLDALEAARGTLNQTIDSLGKARTEAAWTYHREWAGMIEVDLRRSLEDLTEVIAKIQLAEARELERAK